MAQTCRFLAVLVKGRLMFQGDVEELVSRADRRIWTVGDHPRSRTLTGQDRGLPPRRRGTRYRILAATSPDPSAQPSEPTLEDGYLALMEAGR